MGHLAMLKYMDFDESWIKNFYLFQWELSNCLDTPSAQEKVKSVKTDIFVRCHQWGQRTYPIASWLYWHYWPTWWVATMCSESKELCQCQTTEQTVYRTRGIKCQVFMPVIFCYKNIYHILLPYRNKMSNWMSLTKKHRDLEPSLRPPYRVNQAYQLSPM